MLSLLVANIKTTEGRLERRREELRQERHCTIAYIQHHGRAWVLPHPERAAPDIASMVRDDETKRVAVRAVIDHEEARGWQVVSVEHYHVGAEEILGAAE